MPLRDPVYTLNGESCAEALYDPEHHPTSLDPRTTERWRQSEPKNGQVRTTKLKPRSKAMRELKKSLPTQAEIRARAYQRGW